MMMMMMKPRASAKKKRKRGLVRYIWHLFLAFFWGLCFFKIQYVSDILDRVWREKEKRKEKQQQYHTFHRD
jgi:hypothetical protein